MRARFLCGCVGVTYTDAAAARVVVSYACMAGGCMNWKSMEERIITRNTCKMVLGMDACALPPLNRFNPYGAVWPK